MPKEAITARLDRPSIPVRRRIAAILAVIVLALLGVPSPGDASQTTTWEMAGAKDFLKGKMSGVSLTWDGRLQPGYRREEIAAPQQPVVWCARRGPDGTVFLGTGYRGGVYAVRPNGAMELIWNAPEPAVFALTIDARGALYVATSPSGKIYKIEGDTATEWFDPQAQYIWSLAVAGDGTLYAGTGPEGKIFAISPTGQGEVYFASGQAHITSLALDAEGRLLAGSEPNGLLYRISAKDSAFVLHDAGLPEIRAIAVAPTGEVYAAAMGGSVAQKQQTQTAPAGGADSSAPTISTTVTVTAASQNPTGQSATGQDTQQAVQLPQAGMGSAAPAGPLSATSAIYEMTGVERSAVYRIAPDNTVETLWSSKEENVYDIALDGAGLLVATDRDGRVYRLEAKGRANLLAQTEQGQTTGVLPLENGFLAATGNEGKLFRFTPALATSTPASPATYESPVHDAQSVSRWGSISWAARGQAPADAGIRIHTRAGNSFRPDNTWSDWQPIDLAGGGRIQSPNARYLQWKAEFPAPAGAATPALERVTVAYLPQNAAPLVKAVRVASQLKASSSTGTAAAQAAAAASTAAYSITVSATGEGDAAGPAGSTIASTNRLVEPVIQCTWEAEDPDGDTLEYELSYRAEDETGWKPLATAIRETTHAIDASRFADGRYYFRVVATDAPDNSPGVAKQNELISVPVVLDHSAPAIEILNRERSSSGWSLRVRVRDVASMVRRVEISVNAKPLQVVLPVDGIADSLAEEFVIAVSDDAAPTTEKSVVIKATDASGNVATARVLLTSQP
jgi:sugar lactone lactonase YvrE